MSDPITIIYYEEKEDTEIDKAEKLGIIPDVRTRTSHWDNDTYMIHADKCSDAGLYYAESYLRRQMRKGKHGGYL